MVNKLVNEDELPGGNREVGGTTTALFTAAEILSLVSFHTDEPGTVSLNDPINGVDTGLQSNGENILFGSVDATHVNGLAGGRTVFTLVDNGNGTFTFTLNGQIDHGPPGQGERATRELILDNVFKVTDFDGDSVVVDHGLTVTIENDVPVNNDVLLNNVSVGTTMAVTLTAADILSLVSIGADEPGT